VRLDTCTHDTGRALPRRAGAEYGIPANINSCTEPRSLLQLHFCAWTYTRVCRVYSWGQECPRQASSAGLAVAHRGRAFLGPAGKAKPGCDSAELVSSLVRSRPAADSQLTGGRQGGWAVAARHSQSRGIDLPQHSASWQSENAARTARSADASLRACRDRGAGRRERFRLKKKKKKKKKLSWRAPFRKIMLGRTRTACE